MPLRFGVVQRAVTTVSLVAVLLIGVLLLRSAAPVRKAARPPAPQRRAPHPTAAAGAPCGGGIGECATRRGPSGAQCCCSMGDGGSGVVCLPTFVVIGAQKGGSTALLT